MSSHMAKSRPAGLSKTERKRDPQETSALKAPPSPAAGPAEDTGAPVEPARSKPAEPADSPTPGSASAAMPAATPISGRVSEPEAAPPTQSRSESESLAQLNGSSPPSPTASAQARPDPTPTAEPNPPPPVSGQVSEADVPTMHSGSKAEPVADPIGSGLAGPAATVSAPSSFKPDHARDAVLPSPARKTSETSDHKPAPSVVGPAPVDPRRERPASVHPGAEFAGAKEAPLKPKPSTGQDTPGPAVPPAEQLRSPRRTAVQISE